MKTDLPLRVKGSIASVAVALAVSMCSPSDYQTGSDGLLGCRDGIKNGNETAVDCGGDICDKCVLGDTCVLKTDCLSNNCAAGVCRDRHCADSVVDQDEQGVDCGGVDCAPCVGSATCGNKVQDPGETGIDCGGPTGCDRCVNGGTCTIGTDCISGTCVASVCRSTTSGVGGAQGASGSGGIVERSGGGTSSAMVAGGTTASGSSLPAAGPNSLPGTGGYGSGGVSASSAGVPSIVDGGSTNAGNSSTVGTTNAGGAPSNASRAGASSLGGLGGRSGSGNTAGNGAVALFGGSSSSSSSVSGGTSSGVAGSGTIGVGGTSAAGGTPSASGSSAKATGGSAGAAGTANVCSHTAVPSSLLITDFSEFTVGLSWTTGGKAFGTSSSATGDTFHFGTSTTPLTATITSDGALRLSATIPAGQYAGFGLSFGSCYDASAAAGISMTAVGSLGGSSELRFKVQTSRNAPINVSPGRGECAFTSAATKWSECIYNDVAVSGIASTPKNISYAWSGFSGGVPIAPVDPTEILGLQWQFQCGSSGSCAIDVAFDNITFVK